MLTHTLSPFASFVLTHKILPFLATHAQWTELGSSGAAMADDLVAKASAAPGAEGAKGLGAPRLSHVIRLGLFGLG